MDLLKRELQRKKKALRDAKTRLPSTGEGGEGVTVGTSGRRFLKAGTLRRLQEEAQEAERREQQRAARSSKKRARNDEDDKNNNRAQQQQQQQFASKSSGRSDGNDRGADEEGADGNDWEVVATDTAAGCEKRPRKDDSDSDDHDDGKSSTADRSGRRRRSSNTDLNAMLWSLSPDEVTRRLRQVGLPVRLFGERTITAATSSTNGDDDDSSRIGRLKRALENAKESRAVATEKDEFRLQRGHGIRNPFLEKDTGDDHDGTSAAAAAAAAAEGTTHHTNDGNNSKRRKNKQKRKREDNENDDDDVEEEDLSKLDPHKRIYKYFRGLLRQWEEDLSRRSDETKRTVAGKNETKTMKQCKDYIRPLFQLCKARTLEEGLTRSLDKMVEYCVQGEFVKAHDTYMDLAIGRAAWPIGVTMVGIHARTGRAKIESKNVAHIMNSELQRKYLTSIKRLLTYAQSKRTDVDPSKKVMN